MTMQRTIAFLLLIGLIGAAAPGSGHRHHRRNKIYMEQGTFVPDQHTLTAQLTQQVEIVD